MPQPSANPGATHQPVRVWDLPTRLFHWLLVLAVSALIVTGQVGGNAIEWHARVGVAVGALLVFRLVWGVVGGRWSRFASFLYAPATVWRYLRGQAQAHEHTEIGHNPLGALAVLAMLALLAAQVASGLVVDDEIAFTGPLNRFVASSGAALASSWHRGWGASLLYALLALHLAALAFHILVKKHVLLKPMLFGDKALPPGTPASQDTVATRGLALALLGACAGLGLWVWMLGYITP